VDQVKLQAIQARFSLTRRHSYPGSYDGILKERIERAAVPPSKAGHGIGANLPECIETMLQDVRGRALIALIKRSEHRILLLACECIPELNIVLVLGLTQAYVHQVSMGLATQIGSDVAQRIQGMAGGIQVVFILQDGIKRQTCDA